MEETIQGNQTGQTNDQINQTIKKDVNAQIHQHLSTIFVVVGIVSFTLGAIVNWYTIQRIKGGNA
jgi:hypothetical protein